MSYVTADGFEFCADFCVLWKIWGVAEGEGELNALIGLGGAAEEIEICAVGDVEECFKLGTVFECFG